MKGAKIELIGNMFDNTGAPLTDALIEIWQANAAGRYASVEDTRSDVPLDENFLGFGRGATDKAGGYRFRTIRPGRVPGPGNSLQAPHIALGIIGPGILKRLTTRVYFADAPENADDPILALVPDSRRATLIAQSEPGAPSAYRFDIRLGGHANRFPISGGSFSNGSDSYFGVLSRECARSDVPRRSSAKRCAPS